MQPVDFTLPFHSTKSCTFGQIEIFLQFFVLDSIQVVSGSYVANAVFVRVSMNINITWKH